MKVEKTEITKTVQVTTGYKMNVVNDCNNSYSDNELNIIMNGYKIYTLVTF